MSDQKVKRQDRKSYAVEPLVLIRTIPRMGRTEQLVECPFCHTETWTFPWSRAGGGKLCSGCPALLTSSSAHLREGDEDPRG